MLSYLTVNYKQKQKKKDVNILSFHQIVGKHLLMEYDRDIFSLLLENANKFPEIVQIIREKLFNVVSPNNTELVYKSKGKPKWLLIIAKKNLKQRLYFLFLGNRLWGTELDFGIHLKTQTKRFGTEKITEFLIKQIDSMIKTPQKWQSIEVYLKI
ncbi:MAG: hypothetical protein ACTSRZ_08970 [Promethearchaeota archaeon]